MAEANVLNPVDLNYPKAKYKAAGQGEGDVKSPAYEKIVTKDGQAQRLVEFHPYVSLVVKNAKEEKLLGAEWVDHPNQLK